MSVLYLFLGMKEFTINCYVWSDNRLKYKVRSEKDTF